MAGEQLTRLDHSYLASLQETLRNTQARWVAGQTSFYDVDLRPYDLPAGWRTECTAPDSDRLSTLSSLGLRFMQPPGPTETVLPGRSSSWRDRSGRDFVGRAKRQGTGPWCTAFATVTALEIQQRIQLALPVGSPESERLCDLSAAQLMSSIHHDSAATGLGLRDVLEHCTSQGLTAGAPRSRIRVTELVEFDYTDTGRMRDWVAERGPLITSMMLPRNLDFLLYRSGVYEPTVREFLHDAAHCVVIVGFDDDLRAWQCQNSWGTDWGEAGDFRIRYGACFVDTQTFGISGVTRTEDPA